VPPAHFRATVATTASVTTSAKSESGWTRFGGGRPNQPTDRLIEWLAQSFTNKWVSRLADPLSYRDPIRNTITGTVRSMIRMSSPSD
jgi:hypothetical protein